VTSCDLVQIWGASKIRLESIICRNSYVVQEMKVLILNLIKLGSLAYSKSQLILK
jgi:hypothetical protein